MDSIPSALQGSSTKQNSDWVTHPKDHSAPQKQAVPRHIRETAKQLRAIYEDEGLDFGPEPKDDATLIDRFRVATKLSKNRIEEVMRAVRRARNVQLCFVVDVTGSMSSHIDAVRTSINDIIAKLTDASGHGTPEAQSMRIAFVGYRDIGNNPNFEVFNFVDSSSLTQFRDFVGAIRASGGFGNTADVFGGLDTALSQLHWSEECGTNVLFHICDVPCHGTEYHRPGNGDNYPAGDPKGRTAKQLFDTIRQKHIQYHFGKIYDTTDVMIEKFARVYGEPIIEFDVKKVIDIRDSVIAAVSQSITASVTVSQRTVGVVRVERDYKLDKSEPNWPALREVQGSFASYEKPTSIADICDPTVALVRKKTKQAIVKIADDPFGKGAERLAYYGMDVSTYIDHPGAKNASQQEVKKKSEHIVLKESLHVGDGMNSAARYELSNQMQTVASYLAEEFMKDLKQRGTTSKTLKFLKIRTFYQTATKPYRFMSCEKRFAATDKFVRFTNNTDYIMNEAKALALGVSLEFAQLVIAFSHWTYKATNRFLMVVDLEGVVGKIGGVGDDGVLLTDPAIHCKDLTRYRPMNHGPGGMKNFFASHKCNDFCKKLGLEGFGFA